MGELETKECPLMTIFGRELVARERELLSMGISLPKFKVGDIVSGVHPETGDVFTTQVSNILWFERVNVGMAILGGCWTYYVSSFNEYWAEEDLK
ncbi:hypothetical protein [Salmonella phage SSBI34]|nr:hypothetical protein [Salmonella phage SSBI34]